MKRMAIRALSSALVFCSGTALADHSETPVSPYLGAQYAFEISDGDRDSDNGHGFQITFGMPLFDLPHYTTELSFYAVGRERDIDGNDDYQNSLSIDVLRHFGSYGWPEAMGGRVPAFSPFVLLGAALVEEDVAGDNHYHAGVNAGVGALMDLGFRGLALRTEARVLAQLNDRSVPSEDALFDYRLMVGLQAPLSIFFAPAAAVEMPAPADCEIAVVDPETGRSDCGVDSDNDGVADASDECPGTLPGSVVDPKGCPVELTAQVIKGVNFELDSAVLLPESKLILDETAKSLKAMQDPNLLVEIGGHTDPIGTREYNLKLSQQRAEAVRQYLISKDVPAGQLKAQGYGETQPVADNETDEGRARNRRVEFRIILR